VQDIKNGDQVIVKGKPGMKVNGLVEGTPLDWKIDTAGVKEGHKKRQKNTTNIQTNFFDKFCIHNPFIQQYESIIMFIFNYCTFLYKNGFIVSRKMSNFIF
jgi:hypothetical protein